MAPRLGHVFRPVVDRFLEKIKPTPTGCWVWMGTKNSQGYGQLWFRGRLWLAYRVAYVSFFGSTSPGFQLDHLCRQRSCVNPMHLEQVTAQENVRRGESPNIKIARSGFCLHGHPLTEDNLYHRPDRPFSDCLTCRHSRNALRYRGENREKRIASGVSVITKTEVTAKRIVEVIHKEAVMGNRSV